MSVRDVKLKTFREIREAVRAGKDITVWNYEPGDVVNVIKPFNIPNWREIAISSLCEYDLSTHWFSIKDEIPEYRAFKTVEEVEPFYGQCVTGHIMGGCPASGLILGAYDYNNGDIRVEVGAQGFFFSKYLLDNFKFTKTGKPVGIEVK